MLTSLPTSGPYRVDLFALVVDAESLSIGPWAKVPLQDAFPYDRVNTFREGEFNHALSVESLTAFNQSSEFHGVTNQL